MRGVYARMRVMYVCTCSCNVFIVCNARTYVFLCLYVVYVCMYVCTCVCNVCRARTLCAWCMFVMLLSMYVVYVCKYACVCYACVYVCQVCLYVLLCMNE